MPRPKIRRTPLFTDEDVRSLTTLSAQVGNAWAPFLLDLAQRIEKQMAAEQERVDVAIGESLANPAD